MPAGRSMSEGQVDLWRIPLDCAADETPLDAAERERATRFRDPVLRNRFVAAHVAVRQILSEYCGQPAESLRFFSGPHGRPELAGSSIRFNLSHSRDLAICAVSLHAVGVDLEDRGRHVSARGIAARWFSQSERDRLRCCEAAALLREFYRIWTAKEAYLKGKGTGLSGSLSAFSVKLDEARISGVVEDPEWQIRELDPGPGWAGAVALKSSILNARWQPN